MRVARARIKVRPLFAWFDFWVGIFWDRKARKLYIFPAPMFGLMVDFAPMPDGFVAVETSREERELILETLYAAAASYGKNGFPDREATLLWHAGSIANCDHRRVDAARKGAG